MTTGRAVDVPGDVPGGVEVRHACAADVPGIAAVHNRGWQQGYAGLLPQPYLDGLRAEDRLARWTTFVGEADPPRRCTLVAVRGVEVLGFADVAPTRDTDSDERFGVGRVGELRSFYVDPQCWRQGVGRADELVPGGVRRRRLPPRDAVGVVHQRCGDRLLPGDRLAP